MSANVTKTLVRDARKHLKSNMVDMATVQRTLTTVPCLVVVQRWAVPLKGVMSERLRVRKWNLLMPSSDPSNTPDPLWGNDRVIEGDRLVVPGHGTFLVLEITDPNTYNIATSVWAIISNSTVTFNRGAASTGPIDVFIQRVTDEEKNWGIHYDWEVWWDSSVTYPEGTPGGVLISKGDQIVWGRSPNPLPMGGKSVIDQPRYVYGSNGDPICSAYFKESL